MCHPRCAAIALPLLLPLVAGPARAQLQLRAADAGLQQVAARARELLTRPAPDDGILADDGTGTARRVLGLLRLGEAQLARAELLRVLPRWRALPPTTPRATAWVLVALTWYARATADDALVAEWLPLLEPRLAAAERDAPPAAYAAAALLVHARYCMALLDDRAAAADRHRRLATVRLLQLECETWQPGRGHYRPRRADGQLVVPQAADGSLLLPVSAGMLVATGDRLTRHLQTTLACSRSGDERLWHDATEPPLLAALRLIAAAQLGDPDAMATCYRELLAQRSDDAAILSLQLDALLFATTGVRVAIGVGLDESWQRVSPWLPPQVERMDVRGLLVRGRRLRLDIERSPAAAGLRIEVAAIGAAQAPPLQLVVGHHQQQYLTRLGEQAFRCELPPRASVRPRSEAQHEAAAGGAGRR